MTLQQTLLKLHALADPEKVRFKQDKFGVVANNAMGVYQKDIKLLAKEIGADNDLALQLFDSGLYEARILCSKLFKPKDLTMPLVKKWTSTFENWEVTDSFSMTVFAKSPRALEIIHTYSNHPNEFEKRTAFATISSYCMADKISENTLFESLLVLVEQAATDERIYVKKAVNWALRSIGKRNQDMRVKAIASSNKILELEGKAAQWIAKDALRELTAEKLNVLDYPRKIYRPQYKSTFLTLED